MNEKPILADAGYLTNVMQKGVLPKQLKLELYNTNLIITDLGVGKVLEDVPVGDIVSVKAIGLVPAIIFARQGTSLIIKTKISTYKITWNLVKPKQIIILGYFALVRDVLSQRPKSQQWISSISRLKSQLSK